MKDITGASVSTTGNVAMADAVQCSIDATGMGHIMSILSNMYSDKFLAVLREYSANAWDAHVEAGNTHLPIEVTLPSLLQPTLIIKDYGTGLTKDEVINVFGSYGTSTKRNTNDQVGALGIGSKAAFTLGHQFVVTATKDGEKCVVLFSLNESNIGTMKVIHEGVQTDEPNGVTISLAVEDVDSMNETAHRFFSMWKKGRVLVNGEKPESIFETAREINDVTHIIDQYDGAVWVVMGQISYAVGQDILRKVAREFEDGSTAHKIATDLSVWYQESAIFFDVEIGDVDIAPSRESLRDTPRTIAALKQSVSGLADTLYKTVQDAVDAEPNAFRAHEKYVEMRDALQPLKVERKDITYHGLPLREEVEVALPTITMVSHYQYRRGTTWVVGLRDEHTFTLSAARATTVVLVDNLAKHTPTVKRYAKRYLEDTDTNYLVVTDSQGASFGWFTFGADQDAIRTITLDEYKEECKALRSGDPRVQSGPSYSTGWMPASRYMEDRDPLSEIIGWGKDIVVFGHYGPMYLGKIGQDALADYTIVSLTATQTRSALVKRIEADGSVRVLSDEERDKVIRAHAESLYNATDAEKEGLGARRWLREKRFEQSADKWRRLGTVLGAENITSRTFQDVLDTFELANLTAHQITDARLTELQDAARFLSDDSEQVIPFDAEIPEMSEVFPLAAQVSIFVLERDDTLKQHLIDYINTH